MNMKILLHSTAAKEISFVSTKIYVQFIVLMSLLRIIILLQQSMYTVYIVTFLLRFHRNLNIELTYITFVAH